MREILFRGKRVIDGKWVESCCPLGEMHSGTVTYDFVSETVCQYTGLTDKNGRKIFENDIVKQFADCDEMGESLYFFYQIRWNKEYCAFEGFEIYTKETFLIPDLDDIEIIGNIFDNPELIGE